MKPLKITFFSMLLAGAVAALVSIPSTHAGTTLSVLSLLGSANSAAISDEDQSVLKADALLEKISSSSSEPVLFNFTNEEARAGSTAPLAAAPGVDCGEGFPGITPPVTKTGVGPNKFAAADAAMAQVAQAILIASGIQCPPCEYPGQCHPAISLVPGGWVVNAVGPNPGPGGGVAVTMTFTGAYFVRCTDCGLLDI